MSSKSRGFTLIEMIVAIVILGVGLAGVLTAFSTTVKSSADPMLNKQMLAIAEGMLEEILLKPYDAPQGSNVNDKITDCDRSLANEIGDYANYSQPVCDIFGEKISTLDGYTVKVELDSTATLGTLTADVTKITVTVNRGSESFSLSGYRTNYAKLTP